jgi:hypothetical protein
MKTSNHSTALYQPAKIVSAVFASKRDPSSLEAFLQFQIALSRAPSAVNPNACVRNMPKALAATVDQLTFSANTWHVFGDDLRVRNRLPDDEMRRRYHPLPDDRFRFAAIAGDLVAVTNDKHGLHTEAGRIEDPISFFRDHVRVDDAGEVIASGADPLFVQAVRLVRSTSPAAEPHLGQLADFCADRMAAHRAGVSKLSVGEWVDVTLCAETMSSREVAVAATSTGTAIDAIWRRAMELLDLARSGDLRWLIADAGIPDNTWIDRSEGTGEWDALDDICRDLLPPAMRPGADAVRAFLPATDAGQGAIRSLSAWTAVGENVPFADGLAAAEAPGLAIHKRNGAFVLTFPHDGGLAVVAWGKPRRSVAELAPMKLVILHSASDPKILQAAGNATLN